jgi:thioredoxin-dependent peroxiredoxin
MNARTCYAWTCLVATLGAACLADEPTLSEKPPVLESGDSLPAFVSTDEEGKPWKSAEHVGKNVLVFYVYPGDFTGSCIKQAEAFREGLAKLEEQGVELVGVSGDEATTHKLFKET